MKLDLTKGISFKIEGEIGKYNTLPIETLVKIGQSLQELVLDIAKSKVSDSEAIDLNNFKVELNGYKSGSAVPSFIMTPRIKPTISDVNHQREIVSNAFDDIMKVSDSGDYNKLKEHYAEPVTRNRIVDNLYSFVNCFGNSPVHVHNTTEDIKKIGSDIYKIKKFKPETKKALTTDIELPQIEEGEEHFGVAKIKITKKGARKIIDFYKKAETTLSYSPSVIVYGEKAYLLQYPLRCALESEEDFYIIQNEMLDIIGTGSTEDEAELSFAQEFDYIYLRYNHLPENQLSDRLIIIKQFLNHIVKSIEN